MTIDDKLRSADEASALIAFIVPKPLRKETDGVEEDEDKQQPTLIRTWGLGDGEILILSLDRGLNITNQT